MIPVNNLRAPVKIIPVNALAACSYCQLFYHKIWAGCGVAGEGGVGGAATVHYNVVKILDYGGWGCGWELNQLI